MKERISEKISIISHCNYIRYSLRTQAKQHQSELGGEVPDLHEICGPDLDDSVEEVEVDEKQVTLFQLSASVSHFSLFSG